MAYDFRRVRVLLVECSNEMAQLIKTVLNMLSIPEDNIDIAFTPEEAFLKFNNVGHDLIIADWLEYPDRGIHFTRMVRTDPKSKDAFVPIIMTAGSGHRSKVLKARDAGVSDYIVKPFTAETLAKRITKIIEDEREFIVSGGFVGPNRRYRDTGNFDGEDRRTSTVQTEKID